MRIFLFLLIIGALIYFLAIRRKSVAAPSFGALRGTGQYEFDIVGESKYQDALESICGGRTDESAEKYVEALLYLEDANPHDNQAVRVDIEGRTVGYLSRPNARSYRKQLANMGQPSVTCACNAVVVGGWRRSATDQGHFGVKLDLPVE